MKRREEKRKVGRERKKREVEREGNIEGGRETERRERERIHEYI